jgi:pSer/pThr/pTyr-binding forkhead associated (FHA) protein
MSNLSYKNSELNPNTVVQTNSDKRFFLKINKGHEKGAVFQISSSEVLIGRDPSNHIQLKNDSKVSRHHVRLVFKNERYTIQDITKNNFINVNGIKVKQFDLKNNEVIQIGDHILQFVETDANSKSASTQPANNQPQGNNRLRLILILILVMGGGYYFTMPKPKSKDNKIKVESLDNESKSERRIDSIEKTIKELDEKFKDSIYFTENGRNAQSIFIQGKRDFDRGQFFYARDAFGAVLSIEPSHEEARRLLRLSQQFADDLLEKQFKEGLASKESGRFEFCKSSMRNIMNLLNDPANSRYREAKKVLIECELKKRGNF